MGPIRYSIIVILILLIPIGYYFLYYVPSQKDYFTSRNLRLLGDMSQHISQKIAEYKKTIDNGLINNEYISGAYRQDSTDINEKIKKRIELIQNLEYKDSKFEKGTGLLDSLKLQNLTRFSQIKFSLALDRENYLLHIKYWGQRVDKKEPFGTYNIRLKAHASLDSIIAPLMRSEIFQNILFVEYGAERKVVYQASHDEFLAIRLDSLGPDLTETWSSRHEDVTWGNTRYKLYVQPLRIAALSDVPEMGSGNDIELMLIGLVETERFNADSRAISPFKISFFVFLVLLILFSMPLLKLRFIGEQEELRRSDLLLALFCLFVGTGILTLFMLSIYSDMKDKNLLDKSLKPLAQNIESNLNAEIDSLIAQYRDVRARINEAEVDSSMEKIISNREIWKGGRYPYFTQLAWIDMKGLQVLKLRVDTFTPLLRVKSREYFRKIVEGEQWYRDNPHGSPPKQAYYIEPIISISSGINSAVLTMPDTLPIYIRTAGKRSKSVAPAVAAISVHFISLLNPILPEGSGFCIINEAGEVLFHNEQAKNLQENFFTECDDNPRLQAAVFSRVEKSLKVNYLGREHRLFVTPLKNTPWTLITFADLKLLRSAELNALSVGGLLFACLAFLSLVVLSILFGLKILKSFDWLWPQQDRNHTYRLIIVVLFSLAGIYFHTIFQVKPNTNIYLAILVPFIVTLITYILVQQKIELPLLTTLTKRQKLTILSILFIIGVICYFLSFDYLVFGIAGLFTGLILSSEPITRLSNREKFPDYYTRYAMSGVTLLLITSVLPAIAFFKVTYDAELGAFLRHGQLSLLNGIKQHSAVIKKEITAEIMNPQKDRELNKQFTAMRLDFSKSWNIYSDFFFGTIVSTKSELDGVMKAKMDDILKEAGANGNEAVSFLPAKATAMDSIFALLRSYFRIVNLKSWELYRESTADGLWEWKTFQGRLLLLEQHDPENTDSPSIVSVVNAFREPNAIISLGGLFLLILLLLIVFIYFIQKVFAIDVILPPNPHAGKLNTGSISQNTIYIGQPNSGKSEYVKQIQDKHIINFRKENDPEKLLARYENGDEIKDQYKVYVLDHFDLHLDTPKWNRAKLLLLEMLISVYKKTVVIVSTVDPTKFLSRMAQSVQASGEQQDEKIDKDIQERWALILSSFIKKYHNINVDPQPFIDFVHSRCAVKSGDTANGQTRARLEFLCNTIIEQCKHTTFLQRVGRGIIEDFNSMQEEFLNKNLLDDEILQRAEAYYHSIWSVCSMEEKITLYHLARNGFVTPKDAETVRLLMRKGLIRKDPRYTLLNDSFKKFVLKYESTTELEAWKKQQPKSWSNVRTPIITVLIVVALFIFVTQRETFNEGVAWISAFVAAVPALLRFLSIFRVSGAKEAESSSS